MTGVRAVLFDFDGTLIDCSEAIFDTYRYTLQRVGLPDRSDAELFTLIGRRLQDCFADFGAADPEEATRIFREHAAVGMHLKAALLPGAADALRALGATRRLALVTTKARAATVNILRHLNLESDFACLVCGDEVTRNKPHPESVEVALRALELRPDEAWMVGDTLIDIGTARAAGVRVAAVATGTDSYETLRAAEPDLLLRSIDELIPHFIQ